MLQNGVGAIDASTASPDHAVTADGLDAERIEVIAPHPLARLKFDGVRVPAGSRWTDVILRRADGEPDRDEQVIGNLFVSALQQS